MPGRWQISGIVLPLWQFGAARESYEQRFTPEAIDALAVLLLELPPALRWHRKQEVHRHLGGHQGEIRAADIHTAWLQLANRE